MLFVFRSFGSAHWGRGALLFASLWLLMSAAFLTGCDGSGGGGGDGGGGPTGPQPFITLTPDGGPAPRVSLSQGSGSQGATLLLGIEATELQNVRTIDFVLTYPGQLMTVTGVAVGDFLGLDAAVVTTSLDANRLQVLLTRRVGTGASGTGQVLTVNFRGIASGSGRLELVETEAASPGGVPISGIRWLGGDVEVSL